MAKAANVAVPIKKAAGADQGQRRAVVDDRDRGDDNPAEAGTEGDGARMNSWPSAT